MIEIFKYLFNNGFHPRQVLKMIKRKEQLTGTPTCNMTLGAILLLAIEKKKFKVLSYLFSDELLNLWGYPRLNIVLKTL